MESKKQLKAKLTNEISRRFSDRIKILEERRRTLEGQLALERKRNSELSDEVSRLESELYKYREWNERLQDFANMSDEDRIEFLRNENLKYKTQLKMDEMLGFYNSMSNIMFR